MRLGGLLAPRAQFALGCAADSIFAGLAQVGEVFFDAQQNAAGGGFDGRTPRLDIRRAGFALRGDLHERCLAWPREISEVRLYALDQPIPSRLRWSAMPDHVSTARLDHRDVLGKGG